MSARRWHRLVRRLATGFVAAAALSAASPAPPPPAHFDPRELRATIGGPRTPLLILGTPHLTQMAPGYSSAFLPPLLDRLAAFKPEIVAIEALSGRECELLARYKASYPGVAEDYCWDAAPARQATGLDVPAAEAAAAAALGTWPQTPTAAQRRHLAALFLAANDRASAMVQWLRLAPGERRAGDGLDAALVAVLVKLETSLNENIAVAATLAARLGLERVYPVDDHSADSITASLGAAFEQAIGAIWSRPSAFRDDYTSRLAAIRSGADLLGFYRFLNDPATGRRMIEADPAAAAREATPPYYGRRYYAWWEARNLRMVANIAAAFADRPGARVLSIVGATHKPYFETYLETMPSVTLIDTSAFLVGP